MQLSQIDETRSAPIDISDASPYCIMVT
ncbi:hypothetical protein BQ8794_30488 [Mesorhizobium prunaredense]|uniref:Uncharacterized protein n=1 Tax=Mesorhizobium prunaredense TaxID=1631249 RepID=A0A1R3VAY4_9HYPH|nr:hypothetical protein BQ8794_30488 [Mesorhizobium prunaredense]